MTQQYELPPLPEGLQALPPLMQQWVQRHVRVAIEADRKRRGEPVATIRHFQYEGIARNGPSQEAVMIDGAPMLPDGTQLYAASQPADPLAWQPISTAPHETELLLGWEEWDGAWRTDVSMATWGWRKGTVSRMSQHGQATHWMPLPARAMSDIARTVLESAKVEADYMRASGAEVASSFIPTGDGNRLASTSAPESRHLTATGVAVTQGNRTVHKLR
ncbi:MAG: hypothetical protein RBR77_16580 [Thauera sp.]|jgi:hypothetical protein|nr:hypothetical protein [Thauera sp.]